MRNATGTMVMDHECSVKIMAVEKYLLGEFGASERKAFERHYFECESCGEDISSARLKARPVTTLCIDCKTEQERQEKIG